LRAYLEGTDPIGIRAVLVTTQGPRWPATVSKFARSKVLRAQVGRESAGIRVERVGKDGENECPIRVEAAHVNHSHFSTSVRAVLYGESLSH